MHRAPVPALILSAMVLSLVSPAMAQARKPVRSSPPRARSASPRPQAAKPAPRPPAGLTGANLGAILKSLGYEPAPEGSQQRIKVEQETYVYFLDLGFSKSGEWLVCMAHLAPVGDLTKVPAAPLLTLLSTNDSLLGMYFSYDRVNARIMLNATIPNRDLDPESLRNIIEGMKVTVHRTRGLWDTASW
jgi:hypothetical protein